MAALSAVALQAALSGSLRLLKLVASKMNLREAKDDDGWNALHLAAEMGHLHVCRFLVEESGFDVNSTCAEGRTPIHCAAAGGSESVLRYLLDRGGDPAMPDFVGSTPLHDAAEEGHCAAVRMLLSKGVDVDIHGCCGTPLHLACSNDRDQVVKILLEHGADPSKVVGHVLPPLTMAYCGGSLRCMKLLIEAGADVNLIAPSGVILAQAVCDGRTDIVKFLLEAGADPNIPDEDGRIPIMYPAVNGNRELVEILFPKTRPVPSLPDWSVDGIIRSIEYPFFKPQDAAVVEKKIADAKSQGKEAFAKGEYLAAEYFYTMVLENDLDATAFANRSLCWLRMRDGAKALLDARQCKMIRPRWSKAWYREGAALSLLKDYKGAANSFMEALKLDPASDEIKRALREATDALANVGCSGEQNP
ncbi:ankyrin repeat, PH and SEC7 domain containing protein secG [Sorghum bicolor]|uniref:Ankyrin-like protein n=1 Tax=Sorghum bicolor TaxID=4558 RepID=C5YRD2_SORBI|nr:ankyrin repeat, PH and SEC7 domain containing protein secG [Sorghum bicolor]EES16309.1 hypothetical protein SORBI_3008G155900 [Sorghum bicolor]|eukprot:XP_002442471.1 ankyrin repeat, PH and SEC7 domain containing protein secG [Sorghum bicolor]